MRIRKHAKISPLVYTDPALKSVLQTHFCQLNQNPWDVMTFSPPSSPPPTLSQLQKTGASGIDNSSMDSIAIVEREFDDARGRSNNTAEATPRRTRPHREKASRSSNPNEFYYYSGFGPQWGKKRGEVSQDNQGVMAKGLKNKQEIKPSSSSHSGNEDSDYDGFEDRVKGKRGKKRARKTIKAKSLKSLIQ